MKTQKKNLYDDVQWRSQELWIQKQTMVLVSNMIHDWLLMSLEMVVGHKDPGVVQRSVVKAAVLDHK